MRWAVAAIGFAACTGAQAQPTGAPALSLDGVIAPAAGWVELPAVAQAAPAAAPSVAAAWGDPARGCYAVVIGARSTRQNPEDALAELGSKLALVLGTRDWSTAGTDGTAAFTRGEMRGGLRAAARGVDGGAAVVVAACFSNARQPDECAARCQPVLASFDPTKVMP